MSLADLTERAQRFAGPGGRALRSAIRDVREGSESRPESHLRLLIARAGLPEPELNQTLHDVRGMRPPRVDMLFRSSRLVIEYDGDQHRTDPRQYEKDLRRIEAIREAGYTVIQVRSSGLYGDPAGTIARISRALAAARVTR